MKFSMAKAVGVVAVLVGTVCVWEAFQSQIVQSIAEHRFLLRYVVALPIISAPFVAVICFGFMVFREPNKTNICRTIGMLLGVAVLFAEVQILEYTRNNFPGEEYFGSILLALTCLVLPIYVLLAKLAMHGEGLRIEGPQDFFTKPFVIVFSLLVWSSANEFIGLSGQDELVSNPSGSLAFSAWLLPILAGWSTYKAFAAMVGIEPRDLLHFFSKSYVFLMAVFVWNIVLRYQNLDNLRVTDSLYGLVPLLAGGLFYVAVRGLVQLASRPPKPKGPVHA